LFRALESSRPAASRLFNDPYAAGFLHGSRRWLYRIARFELGRRLVERLLDRAAPGARAAGIARTKWIDDEITAALDTATQLVLLGAGFDTRAFRLHSYGEPWTFGFCPNELGEYLAARGFRLLADFSVADVGQRAGRSGSGTHGYEFYRLASARVAL